nr:VWA domain-containing protein [Bacteroidota bacterium]
MKKLSFSLLLGFIVISNVLFANGVAIKDAETSEYFRLVSSDVDVTVYDQIAIVIATQKFLNNTGELSKIKYAFPLGEDASGIGLRWNLGNTWYSAIISPSPQDTTLPGGGTGNTNLMDFLGETPLFFNLEDSIPNDSILIVELTYVQLLPYAFYEVDFNYPNDYSLIQNELLDSQHIHFSLESQRAITNIELLSHTPGYIFFNDSTAEFDFEVFEVPANHDYEAIYDLNPEDLGLFSYSTYLTDTAFNCDEYGNGFFTFIVEPDPQSEIIQKVFTLIIDRSGSMSGDKIIQARNAASYIVNNLNEGDYFNIVDFSTNVSSLFEDHVAYDLTSQSSALAYISNMYANGSTNISGAFSTAIPDFATNDTTLANIIIFFTDGQATAGLVGTNEILDHIQGLININEVSNLQIHTFGIGEDANQSLLSQIASQNNGLSEFLGDDELEEIITTFYMKIRNPVLINTQISVDPPLLTQIYPNPVDNLYLGQQLIMVGRYQEASTIDVTFSGEAFGQPQSYQYTVDLADTTIFTNQFLTKLWAKKKMDNLYILYLTFDPESPEAEEIREEVIGISICYNVMSPFTSYTGGGGIVSIEYDETVEEYTEELSYAYPNPFASEAYIQFIVNQPAFELATLRIFDSFGRLIDVETILLTGEGTYKILWDGADQEGNPVPHGFYFYTIQYGNQMLKGEIIKL